jgi:TonB family protein
MRFLTFGVVSVLSWVGCSRGDRGASVQTDGRAVQQQEIANREPPVDARRPIDLIPGGARAHMRSPGEIPRRYIRRCRLEAQTCYQAEVARHPGMNGSVTVGFTIGARGLVVASELKSSTLGNPAMETCLVDFVRKCDFPSPMGGRPVAISYTFDFPPRREPPVTVGYAAGAPRSKGTKAPHR